MIRIYIYIYIYIYSQTLKYKILNTDHDNEIRSLTIQIKEVGVYI